MGEGGCVAFAGRLFHICFCSLDVHGGRQHPAYDQIAKFPQGVLRFKGIVEIQPGDVKSREQPFVPGLELIRGLQVLRRECGRLHRKTPI